MRRLPINLAAEPIEAVRRARRIVTRAGVVLLALTLVQVGILWWVSPGDEPVQDVRGPAVPVETLREWASEVDRLAAVADVQRARQAANAVKLANQLIAWRTIPWSSIFADLETLLPDRVRLETVQPTVEQGERDGDVVRVSMTAAAQDPGPLQDLLIALESSPRFREVLPQREDVGPDGLSRMLLWARYVPADQRPDAAVAGGVR